MQNDKSPNTFVTILCIVNWVFLGLGLFMSVFLLLFSSPMNRTLNSIEELNKMQSSLNTSTSLDSIISDSLLATAGPGGRIFVNKMADFTNEILTVSKIAMQRMPIWALFALGSCAILILGTVLIYKMQKSGFPVYMLGALVLLGGYIYSMGPLLMRFSIATIGYWMQGGIYLIVLTAMCILFFWQMRKAGVN